MHLGRIINSIEYRAGFDGPFTFFNVKDSIKNKFLDYRRKRLGYTIKNAIWISIYKDINTLYK